MDRRQRVNLSVHPSRGLIDEKFVVLVQSCLPGCQLTLHALHHCEDGNSWEAFGHYTSDASGAVNASMDPSLGGTYSGVEPMALMWSMRTVPGSKPGLRLRMKNVQKPMEVAISVYLGHQTEGFEEKVKLANVLVERWYMAPGVRRIPITESDLTATLFLPPGPGPFPGVIDMWGGTGQLVEYRSALLASHGFASLALDYLTPKITLETGKMVGNDYFETAFQLLQKHPQVLGSKIGMVGISFGSSMALKMAAYSQIVKPACIMCVSASHVQQVEGSVAETFKYFEENRGKTRYNELNEVIWRDLLLPIPTDPALKVDMGRIQCPLMLVVGEDDQNWPAAESAQDMKDMMERAGNSHLLSIHSYPNTGHLIEPPYSPHTRVSIFKQQSTKVMALWGGETAAHSQAMEDAWKKMLTFLKAHLYGNNSSPSLLGHH
ncbi:peroxisomal succinyl-coenzyme A thioesterase-like [Synchiropus splendidus]|uniref:peroxisomal succinyl-coenzyme A thioesterase-like n=1 Tax=Synchiropus splendidus TaxID=270530 RepID=UPI00237E7FAF|nr:peroxisomal succinyl-coenzyme A thioesterase-like [Synchiropus splendidus]XP_053741937.1 peroxisomal succinyl-coenzyme A thioesterase-like [Synchiropus splendidus]